MIYSLSRFILSCFTLSVWKQWHVQTKSSESVHVLVRVNRLKLQSVSFTSLSPSLLKTWYCSQVRNYLYYVGCTLTQIKIFTVYFFIWQVTSLHVCSDQLRKKALTYNKSCYQMVIKSKRSVSSYLRWPVVHNKTN